MVVAHHALRSQRIAVTAIFALTGAVFGSWAVRVADVQEQLDLSAGRLGLAVLALEGGALAGLPAGGALVSRGGGRLGLRLGFSVYPPALVAAGAAPAFGWLLVFLVFMAAANSVIDVAMNAEGAALEARARRPLMAGAHAGHSFGALGAALGGTLAVVADVELVVHFAVVAAVAVVGAQTATRALPGAGGPDANPSSHDGTVAEPLPAATAADASGPGDEKAVGASPGSRRRLVLLGAVAACAFGIEGSANAWSAVHLRSVLDAEPTAAAAAFTAFSLAVALVRLRADAVVARLGRLRAVRASGLLASAGLGLVVAAPEPGLALAGWALTGAGVAGIAPTVFAAAPAGAAPAASAIALVSTIGYVGSFTVPPLVGALAGVVGLQAALALPLVAAALMVVLAGRALAPGRPL